MLRVADLVRRLAADHERTSARLAELRRDFLGMVEASRDTNADDEHDPEGATIAFERSQLDALIRQAQERLTQIESAQARVASGTYGTCETCRERIAPDRLEARPFATTCVRCAAQRRG